MGCVSRPLTESFPAHTPLFSQSGRVGELPPGWLPYVLRRDLPQTRYQLVSLHDRMVLEAAGAGTCSGLSTAVRADPAAMGHIRWSWRTATVPDNLDVGGERDDSPARLVLGFDGDRQALSPKDKALFEFVELVTGHRLPYATLMYVWDGKLPVGTVVANARTARIRYLVVESGSARAGQWLAYRRDVCADFRQVFGEDPREIRSIGVLTDSDDTMHRLQTWYGDIVYEDAQPDTLQPHVR